MGSNLYLEWKDGWCAPPATGPWTGAVVRFMLIKMTKATGIHALGTTHWAMDTTTFMTAFPRPREGNYRPDRDHSFCARYAGKSYKEAMTHAVTTGTFEPWPLTAVKTFITSFTAAAFFARRETARQQQQRGV